MAVKVMTLTPIATADMQRLKCEAAEAVRQWRRDQGWSRKQVGAFFGVDPVTVWRWEEGLTVVRGDVLLAIQERRAA